MRRSVLLTLAALGALVSLIGGAGLFSALTDTARTGTNSAESAPLAASADIQLATATVVPGPSGENLIQCGTFSENLTSGLFTVTGVTPGYSSEPPVTYLCISNVGSQAVSLSMGADELVEVDYACTGDESLAGDLTCGSDAVGNDGVGELGSVLMSGFRGHPTCNPAVSDGANMHTLDGLSTTPVVSPSGSLGPGIGSCFSVWVEYPTTAPTAAQQRAQSDRVTWRFRFDATALP